MSETQAAYNVGADATSVVHSGLLCPSCGLEVVALTNGAVMVEYPRATIFSARIRCPHCGYWTHFSAKRGRVPVP